MFDGTSQIAKGTFGAFGFRAQQSEVEIQGRMIETSFQRSFQLVRSHGFLAFGLRIDGLSQVQDDFGLLGLVQG